MKATIIILLLLFLSGGTMAQEAPKTADQLLTDACKKSIKGEEKCLYHFSCIMVQMVSCYGYSNERSRL